MMGRTIYGWGDEIDEYSKKGKKKTEENVYVTVEVNIYQSEAPNDKTKSKDEKKVDHLRLF